MRWWLEDPHYGAAWTATWTEDQVRKVAAAWAATSDEEWLELACLRSSWTTDDLLRIRTAQPAVRQAMLACASLSRNGRVRESVVGIAGELADPAALRWLLPRLVDWVPEVRTAAFVVAERLSAQLDASQRFELCRRHARWLLSQERAEVQRFMGVLAATLSTECRDLARAFVLSQPAGTSALVRLLLANEDVDVPLLAELLRAPDRTVRQLLATRLARHAAELDEATVDFLLGAAGPEARSRFLAELSPAQAARYEPRLRAACGSRQRRVRTQAQWHLSRLGVDVPAFVSQQLATVPATEAAGWLLALGDCGDRARRAELEAWLEAPDRRHRCHALTALQRLVGDAMWDVAVAWMAEGDEAEARTALLLLRRIPRSKWLDAVRALTRDEDAVVRDRAHDLLTRHAGALGWQVVSDLLAALLAGHRPETTWQRFGHALGNQKARCWANTSPSTRRALRESWDRWRAAPIAPPAEFAERFAVFARSIAALIAIP